MKVVIPMIFNSSGLVWQATISEVIEQADQYANVDSYEDCGRR